MAWPKWIEYLTNISHLATTFNSSVNFYIYIAKKRHNTTERHNGREGLNMTENGVDKMLRVLSIH